MDTFSSHSKHDLRSYFKRKRSLLSSERKALATSLVKEVLLSKIQPNAKVLSFSSMQEEIDLSELNKALMERGALYLPKIEDDLIQPYFVSNVTSLILSKYDILEPNPVLCSRACLEEIKIILVPALCFDTNHMRLGYGKGYYDKFLSLIKQKSPDISIWGIGFNEQLYEGELPCEEHDEKLSDVFLF